jgi:hypothetical protein
VASFHVFLGGYTQRLTRWPPHINEDTPGDLHHSKGRHPETFGAYQSVWQKHRLWSTDGTYARMFDAVREQAGLDQDDVESVLSIDSTVVRAYQHAAGARQDSVVSDAAQDTGGSVELQEFSGRARGAA